MACTVWAALAMFGLGVLLTQVTWLYEAIRLLGAAYLVYLGARTLLSARHPYPVLQVRAARRGGSALRTGLAVGMTNPKSAAFFGSLFVTVLPVGAPILVQGSALVIVAVIALGWFWLLALMFSAGRVRSAYATLRRPIDAVMGTVMLGLGPRLAATPQSLQIPPRRDRRSRAASLRPRSWRFKAIALQ